MMMPGGGYGMAPGVPPVPAPTEPSQVGWPSGGMDIMALIAALNLNDEQREQLAAITDEAARRTWELMGNIIEYKSEINRMRAEQRRLAEAIGTIRLDMQQVGVDAATRAEGLLTPSQRMRLEDMRQRFAPPPPPLDYMMGD
jgi:Spy/CpxP family protein refolding chaperone